MRSAARLARPGVGQLSTVPGGLTSMKPTRTRSLSVAAVALTLLASPLASAYAASRPHTRDDLVAHTKAATRPRPLPVSGLPVGADPAIPYAFASKPEFGGGNWRLHRPDGTTLRLPGPDLGQLGADGRGSDRDGRHRGRGRSSSRSPRPGSVRTRMVEHFGLVVSPDHEIVGWLGDHGTPHVVEGGGSRRFDLPRLAQAQRHRCLVGRRAPARSRRPRAAAARCSPTAATGSGSPTRTASSTPSARCSRSPTSTRAAGSSAWCHGVRRSSERAGASSAPPVIASSSTCDYYLDSFSPDGRRVLAEKSQVRWDSIRRVAILDRDGQALRTWTFRGTRNRSLSQLTWEDEPPPARRAAVARPLGSGPDRDRRQRRVRRDAGRRPGQRVQSLRPAQALTPSRARRRFGSPRRSCRGQPLKPDKNVGDYRDRTGWHATFRTSISSSG